MKNDKEKFKTELKRRIYSWILRLIKFLDNLPKDTITQRIVDQLFRSGGSVGANYIEAQASSSKKDFANFLHHSLKSANESKFWLAVLRDTKRGDTNEINQLLDELIEISNILGASLITVKGRK
ncbi:MAG: four helix bundle protein [Candidatus Portnoybacteria bacterium CG10_big_fil_rev_8_21_14_0_10_38_18]|uniref:Four helix bundle protein n=1 Tax=Candidatus Portnoybacteria bacterium CG10_big_fil_rev_8_21_14_0_10_38_18 TaxID=1974813 RepID=A0A2M8KC87_9BACT|nr:MAG: four helix bundle protein [Candidatus Portnoybacteria bacterium CG10_big_fil_rev_8_21_14_0_10_38_18]